MRKKVVLKRYGSKSQAYREVKNRLKYEVTKKKRLQEEQTYDRILNSTNDKQFYEAMKDFQRRKNRLIFI